MAFSRTRFLAEQRRKPSIQHEREPHAPLPLPGCHCERCENARDDAHGAKVGALLGLDKAEDPTP